MRAFRKSCLPVLAILCVAAGATWQAWPQASVGRGARDPLRVDVIVGSEGKGMYAGAGIPADNMPIFAARDGAVPAGVQPLPHDIFSTRISTRIATSGPTSATTAATRRSASSRSGARMSTR